MATISKLNDRPYSPSNFSKAIALRISAGAILMTSRVHIQAFRLRLRPRIVLDFDPSYALVLMQVRLGFYPGHVFNFGLDPGSRFCSLSSFQFRYSSRLTENNGDTSGSQCLSEPAKGFSTCKAQPLQWTILRPLAASPPAAHYGALIMTTLGCLETRAVLLIRLHANVTSSRTRHGAKKNSAISMPLIRLRSERESYGDSEVGYVQVRRDGVCVVKAPVTPEHNVREKCYAVTCTCNETEETILSVQCVNCAAHLACLHRRSEDPLTTSVECYWKKSESSSIGTSLKYIKGKDRYQSLYYKATFPQSLCLKLSGLEFNFTVTQAYSNDRVVEIITKSTMKVRITNQWLNVAFEVPS
ncbi:hypothetical protein EVAR_30628_1 [Eumeta japonica]|uniref:Uncharacterized protein n=1 Tax=Eumeta variegata TaxID=151549 RepID=A0A4C1W846_EUMVA|nr:hypothetical protein EVAR_30628_1 [Eumeta japonica]